MTDFLIKLDTDIFLWLNSFHSLYFDVVMKMASGRLVWAVLYASLLFALWRTFGWKVTVVFTLCTVAAVALADQISASVLRPMFERMRPSNPDNPISSMVHIVSNYRGGRYGFPSCHAANTFAVATVMALLFGKWRFSIFIYLWALLNCYSRIYLGVHYPGDLLAGLLIGSICGAVMYLVAVRLAKTMVKRVKPHPSALLRFSLTNGSQTICRPLDSVIWAEILTILFILICATAIF